MLISHGKNVEVLSMFQTINAVIRKIMAAAPVLVGALFLFSTPFANAAQVTLEWNENNETFLTGYKVYYGKTGGDLSNCLDIGNESHGTIQGLDEGTWYSFSVTAYDKFGGESNLSDIVDFQTPVSTPPDSDNDGIIDDEEIAYYGTDPTKADTDSDGLSDSEELTYWGDNWDADLDGDGLINILDADSPTATA